MASSILQGVKIPLKRAILPENGPIDVLGGWIDSSIGNQHDGKPLNFGDDSGEEHERDREGGRETGGGEESRGGESRGEEGRGREGHTPWYLYKLLLADGFSHRASRELNPLHCGS